MPDGTVVTALDELLRAGREAVAAWIDIMARAEELRACRLGGGSGDSELRETMLIAEALGVSQSRVGAAAAKFRRAVVSDLLTRGWSIADIARGFGVSRQRIANLIASGRKLE